MRHIEDVTTLAPRVFIPLGIVLGVVALSGVGNPDHGTGDGRTPAADARSTVTIPSKREASVQERRRDAVSQVLLGPPPRN